jgi:hypothetical protein
VQLQQIPKTSLPAATIHIPAFVSADSKGRSHQSRPAFFRLSQISLLSSQLSGLNDGVSQIIHHQKDRRSVDDKGAE